MEETRRKWIEAAKILGKNPLHKVKCPECERGYLFTRDEIVKGWEDKVDRFMICNYCGKYNILTMQRSDDFGSFKSEHN